MKISPYKFLVALIGVAAAVSAANAESFTLTSGEVLEGEVYKVLDGKATLTVLGGEKQEIAIGDFEKTTRKAIESWAEANPDRVDVYTKWDAMPVIKASVMPQLPEEFHDPAFQGMVSVDLVLDSEGRVISAKIKKSSHEGLEGPSLEAAKAWLFEPAKIGGKAVKSKLRVPFKFVFVPKPEPAQEPSA